MNLYTFIVTCNSLQETNLIFFALRNFRCNCREKTKKSKRKLMSR